MAKLTPNIPYEDLGNFHQLAEYHAAWVMESSESVSYLALSDFRPVQCGSTVLRRASFGDIEALAGELPMLVQRSYRIGCEQGIVVLAAAVIDRLWWKGRENSSSPRLAYGVYTSRLRTRFQPFSDKSYKNSSLTAISNWPFCQ
jgi:hypothetical protein